MTSEQSNSDDQRSNAENCSEHDHKDHVQPVRLSTRTRDVPDEDKERVAPPSSHSCGCRTYRHKNIGKSSHMFPPLFRPVDVALALRTLLVDLVSECPQLDRPCRIATIGAWRTRASSCLIRRAEATGNSSTTLPVATMREGREVGARNCRSSFNVGEPENPGTFHSRLTLKPVDSASIAN